MWMILFFLHKSKDDLKEIIITEMDSEKPVIIHIETKKIMLTNLTHS